MCWKQQLGAYEKNHLSGQVLKPNWSSKRRNRKVGNAQRTAEVQVHTRISFCISSLILLKWLALFLSTTFASPCPEFTSFQCILQNCSIYSEYYPFVKAAAILHCRHIFIFKFIWPNDAAFQRSPPSFVLSQAFSFTCTLNRVHIKMHYSSPSYAYAHSSAEVWADILSALQMAWPVDAVNN